jgi:hypothetical protein
LYFGQVLSGFILYYIFMASPDQQEGSAFRPGYAEVSGFVRAPSRQPKRIQDMQPLPGEVVRYIVGSHGELRRITVEDVLIAALTRGRQIRLLDMSVGFNIVIVLDYATKGSDTLQHEQTFNL